MTNNNAKTEETVDFIDFWDIWRTVSHYKYFLAIFLSIVAVIAVYVVSKMTPTYVATATLLLNDNYENVLNLNAPIDIGGNDEFVVTEMEVIQSRNMIGQVIDALDMANHPSFNAALKNPGMAAQLATSLRGEDNKPKRRTEESARHQMIGVFGSNLTVKSIPQTRLISVTYESSSPTLARDAANTLSELYIKRHDSVFKENAEREAKWLEERIEQVRGQLQDLEVQLSDFLESNDLIVVDGVSGLSAAKIKQLKVQVLKEQQRNLKFAGIKSFVDEVGSTDLDALFGIEYVALNPTIQILRQAQIQAQQKVNELSIVYGPKHPLMINAKKALSEANNNLLQDLKVLLENTEITLTTSNHVLEQLKKELMEARAEHQKNQKLENHFINVTKEIESSRQLYEKLLQQALHNRLKTASHVGIASIVDAAFTPPYPVKPKKKLIVGMMIVMAAAFAITVILFVDAAMNYSFRSANDVNKHLGVELLGITPKCGKLKKHNLDVALADKDHAGFVEAIRTVKTNLLLHFKQDNNQKLIAVTSTVAGEGKSTVALNLAYSLVGQGKVLLIDADLRQPSIGAKIGMEGHHVGLVELLRGEARFADCVYRDPRSGISVLPAGGECDDPLDLLFSPRFHLLLKRLKHHYRYVIVDSVQTESVSDAFVVAKKVDTVVYVIKSSSTKRAQVLSVFERLNAQGIDVSGVVATYVDVNNKQNRERFANYYDFNTV